MQLSAIYLSLKDSRVYLTEATLNFVVKGMEFAAVIFMAAYLYKWPIEGGFQPNG